MNGAISFRSKGRGKNRRVIPITASQKRKRKMTVAIRTVPFAMPPLKARGSVDFSTNLWRYHICDADGNSPYTVDNTAEGEQFVADARNKRGLFAGKDMVVTKIPLERSLIVPRGNWYFDKPLFFKEYPLGSYAVDYDRDSAKPVYKVVEISDSPVFVRSGQPLSSYGKVVGTFQAFSPSDNEKFKQKAIDKAQSLNLAFNKKQQAIINRAEKTQAKRAVSYAEAMRGQSVLLGGGT